MFDFILSRMSLLWIFLFFLYFLPRTLKWWKALLIFAACFGICTVCECAAGGCAAVAAPASTLIQGVLILLAVFAVCKYHDGRALFVGLTGIVYVLFGGVAGMEIHVRSGRFFEGLFAAAALNLMLFLFVYIKLRRVFLRQLEREDSLWFKLCIVPLLFCLLAYSITIWPADIGEYPDNLAGILILVFLMVISYIIFFYAMGSYDKYWQQKYDIVRLEQYAAGMRKQMEQMRVIDEKNAILRHDMRHYAAVFSGYLQNKEYDKLEEVVAGAPLRLEELKSEIFCENVAINSVVAQYAAQARRRNVQFCCEMDIPPKLSINEVEFAVALANLLSNAVREAGADKNHPGAVRIKARRIKQQLALEISNTFVNEIKFDKDELPVSGRGEGHGYGSRSVRAFAHKYGTIDCQVENGLFIVRLALFLMKP